MVPNRTDQHRSIAKYNGRKAEKLFREKYFSAENVLYLYAKVCSGKRIDPGKTGLLFEKYFFDATIAFITRLTIALLFEFFDSTNLSFTLPLHNSFFKFIYEYQTALVPPATLAQKGFHEKRDQTSNP